MTSLSEQALRTALGETAAGHRPDRAAIRHRMAAHDASHRTRGHALRLAASALAVAALLGFGGIARWALTREPGNDLAPATSPPPSATPTTAITPE